MKTKRARYIRKRLFNMAFILPLLIVNITFFVIPFVKSLYMSLFDWKLLGNKLFIGLMVIIMLICVYNIYQFM